MICADDKLTFGTVTVVTKSLVEYVMVVHGCVRPVRVTVAVVVAAGVMPDGQAVMIAGFFGM